MIIKHLTVFSCAVAIYSSVQISAIWPELFPSDELKLFITIRNNSGTTKFPICRELKMTAPPPSLFSTIQVSRQIRPRGP